MSSWVPNIPNCGVEIEANLRRRRRRKRKRQTNAWLKTPFLTYIIAHVQSHHKNPAIIRRKEVLRLHLFDRKVEPIRLRTQPKKVPLWHLNLNLRWRGWTPLQVFS
jgi:hypothetical protein